MGCDSDEKWTNRAGDLPPEKKEERTRDPHDPTGVMSNTTRDAIRSRVDKIFEDYSIAFHHGAIDFVIQERLVERHLEVGDAQKVWTTLQQHFQDVASRVTVGDREVDRPLTELPRCFRCKERMAWSQSAWHTIHGTECLHTGLPHEAEGSVGAEFAAEKSLRSE
jgi:hypothetical protein